MRILQARILEWVAVLPPGDLPHPGIEPASPTLQVDALPPEPPGKPKNTRVGSLTLLQDIFATQGLNQDLLHCKWIPYQRGNPLITGLPGNSQESLFYLFIHFWLFWAFTAV